MTDRPRRKSAVKPASAKSASARPSRRSVAAPAPKPKLVIDILLDEPAWLAALPDHDVASLSRRLRGAARRAMAIATADRWRGSSLGHECCLVLSNDRQVRRLNRDYRGKDKATNVLSFAALDSGKPPRRETWPLGDIILAFGVVRQEAKAQKKTVEQHLMHLVIHGVLHLLGYDHEDDDEANRMEALETAALKRLGIDNPYVTM